MNEPGKRNLGAELLEAVREIKAGGGLRVEPGKRIPEISGDEHDAFSRRVRRLLKWRPGQVKLIKRGYWRRFRAEVRQWLKGQEE